MDSKGNFVLASDDKIYQVDDFIASGGKITDVYGVVFGSPLIGLRAIALDKFDTVFCDKEFEGGDIVSYNESEALMITSGLKITESFCERHNKDDSLPKKCWEYRKGKYQWYCPSLLELHSINLCFTEIIKTVEKINSEFTFFPFSKWNKKVFYSCTGFRSKYNNGCYFIYGIYNNRGLLSNNQICNYLAHDQYPITSLIGYPPGYYNKILNQFIWNGL